MSSTAWICTIKWEVVALHLRHKKQSPWSRTSEKGLDFLADADNRPLLQLYLLFTIVSLDCLVGEFKP